MGDTSRSLQTERVNKGESVRLEFVGGDNPFSEAEHVKVQKCPTEQELFAFKSSFAKEGNTVDPVSIE